MDQWLADANEQYKADTKRRIRWLLWQLHNDWEAAVARGDQLHAKRLRAMLDGLKRQYRAVKTIKAGKWEIEKTAGGFILHAGGSDIPIAADDLHTLQTLLTYCERTKIAANA